MASKSPPRILHHCAEVLSFSQKLLKCPEMLDRTAKESEFSSGRFPARWFRKARRRYHPKISRPRTRNGRIRRCRKSSKIAILRHKWRVAWFPYLDSDGLRHSVELDAESPMRLRCWLWTFKQHNCAPGDMTKSRSGDLQFSRGECSPT